MKFIEYLQKLRSGFHFGICIIIQQVPFAMIYKLCNNTSNDFFSINEFVPHLIIDYIRIFAIVHDRLSTLRFSLKLIVLSMDYGLWVTVDSALKVVMMTHFKGEYAAIIYYRGNADEHVLPSHVLILSQITPTTALMVCVFSEISLLSFRRLYIYICRRAFRANSKSVCNIIFSRIQLGSNSCSFDRFNISIVNIWYRNVD